MKPVKCKYSESGRIGSARSAQLQMDFVVVHFKQKQVLDNNRTLKYVCGQMVKVEAASLSIRCVCVLIGLSREVVYVRLQCTTFL